MEERGISEEGVLCAPQKPEAEYPDNLLDAP
jgi:hypothetical protein